MFAGFLVCLSSSWVYGHSIQHMNMTLGTSFRTRFDSVLVCASWRTIIIQ
jgi:hypothetical protein